MPTAQSQINRALRIINVLAARETPSAADSNVAFTVLNAMLSSWNIKQLYVYQFQDETHTLIAGTGSYTIGTGGDISTVRPVRIQGAYVRDSDGEDTHLDVINKPDYDRINDKDLGGLPSVLFYDPAFPLGTVNLWKVPDAASTLHIKTWKPFSAFSTLATDIDLPPGYEQLLVYNLAVLLGAEFNAPVREDVMAIALNAKAEIEDLNNKFQRQKVRFDRSFSTRRYL